jgi:hypothetical protein
MKYVFQQFNSLTKDNEKKIKHFVPIDTFVLSLVKINVLISTTRCASISI